ncbi:MAG: tRNA pseudouridine55 synthase [Verrucomicrobiota bacterium]|jgi:tRNA pseudouridine55 synthase|nr:tRNA pseudouridine55 synthase [Verrucomicrobiota bacterium]MDK2963307.1 tRNA pseudouridine55 synthase [Verrucomicrobiota bacterium]
MRKRNVLPDPDGILLIDKAREWTSHDLVAKVRNHFQLNKVGHGGTLDPNATGLVALLIGRGTKLSAKIMGGDKTYEGEILLGIETDSQDTDGEITAEKDPSGITEEQLCAEMKKALGDQMQMPPMVSAIKKNGVPLYKLARKGQEIDREPRFIHVYKFSLHEFALPRFTFELKCTKGTYVRTIAYDLGRRLGCGACLSQLRRTQSGEFSLSDAWKLDDVIRWDRAELEKHLIPLHVL